MKQVELYAKVRYAVRIEGLSKRAAARRFGIDPRTVDKMMEFSVPPGYRRSRQRVVVRISHTADRRLDAGLGDRTSGRRWRAECRSFPAYGAPARRTARRAG